MAQKSDWEAQKDSLTIQQLVMFLPLRIRDYQELKTVDI